MVFIKYLLSFVKKTWMLEDYPVEVYKNKNAGDKSVAYGAKIINWTGMVGHDESETAAIETLRNNFNIYKSNNEKLPRPGTKVPLRLASSYKMSIYENVAVDFFSKILNVDYYDGFYSDKSYMQYLELMIEDEIDNPEALIIQRVRDKYNVDITDIYNEPLWVILKTIEESKKL